MYLLQKHGKELELSHIASNIFENKSNPNSIIAVSTQDGKISICDCAKNTIDQTLEFSFEIHSVSVCPSGKQLAIINQSEEGLSVYAINNHIVYKITNEQQIAYKDCWFDSDGLYLWSVGHLSNEEIIIQVYQVGHWKLVAQTVLTDPFGDSHLSFHETGHNNILTLWIAAGQDGQSVVWIKWDGSKLEVQEEPLLQNTTPPVFAPDGQEMLVITSAEAVQRFSFPVVKPGDMVRSPFGEEAAFDCYISYLNQQYALIQLREDRIALLETATMRVLGEVIIQGHEPKPTHYYYPSLEGDEELCTDISYFLRIHDVIVFVMNKNTNCETEHSHHTLLVFSVQSILDQITEWHR